MNFNIKLFNVLATKAFYRVTGEEKSPLDFTVEDVLFIFGYYFQIYEYVFREVHPHIRVEQIERIIKAMPHFALDSYEVLIDRHFNTQYRNCDYNINHFFSGDIRLMRLYES